MKLYKVLSKDGSAFWGGSGKWHLPVGSRPGKWMPPIQDIVPCSRGYHVLKPEMLIDWLGPAIFEVEVRGAEIWESNKGVVEQARLVRRLETWNEQTARLLACDYAADVMHLMRDEHSKNTIRVGRRYAFGLADEKELAAAQQAAELTALKAAEAWDAAGAAAYAMYAARVSAVATTCAEHAACVVYAASGAARAAATVAEATGATYATSWAQARAAQTKRLFQYLDGEVDLETIRNNL